MDKNKKDGELSVVDIGNFCLLTNKYRDYLLANGQNVPDDEEIKRGVSESISSLLEIMDGCQKALYSTDYAEENIENMLKFKEMFEEGLITLHKVLEGFAIATCERGEANDRATEK